MNIKNIIKSQKVRHRLMKFGAFIPDFFMLSLQYKILLHRWPNLKKPKRFTEWIQIYKMVYRNPLLQRCVDKYAVRQFVVSKIGDSIMVNLYQVCPRAEMIKFENLPNKFVIKTTSGGNGDNVVVVYDKTTLDINTTRCLVNSWLYKNYSNTSREWAYSKAATNPQIIVEEFIEHDKTKGLDDYKFFCFNGKCKFFKVDFDRFYNHRANYYSASGEFISVTEDHLTPDPNHKIVSAEELEKMIRIAEKLSLDFPFVRVDLYNSYGKIIFGEMTFYPANGYNKFSPDDFDLLAGSYFPNLNEKIWTEYIHAGK